MKDSSKIGSSGLPSLPAMPLAGSSAAEVPDHFPSKSALLCHLFKDSIKKNSEWINLDLPRRDCLGAQLQEQTSDVFISELKALSEISKKFVPPL